MKSSKRWPALVAAAVFTVGGFGLTQMSVFAEPSAPTTKPSARPERPERPTPVSLTGEVIGFNLDPHGNYSGINLKDGDHTIQLNAPPHVAATLVSAAPIGQKVQATGVGETIAGDRSIYRLVSLTTANGQTMNVGDGPEGRKTMHAEGTVKSLNYTPRGEVDGAILDSGDFVHVDPKSAAELKLAVGMKVSAEGEGEAMLMGHNSIDATMVNDTKIARPPRPMHEEGGPGHGGRGGPGGQMGGRHMGPPQDDKMGPPDHMQGPREGKMNDEDGPREGGPDHQRGPRGGQQMQHGPRDGGPMDHNGPPPHDDN